MEVFLRHGPARFVLGLLWFLPAATVVNDLAGYHAVVLQGHLGGAQRVFWLRRNGHNLSIDAGEQLRLFELLGILLAHAQGQGRETFRPQAHHQEGTCYSVVNRSVLVLEAEQSYQI